MTPPTQTKFLERICGKFLYIARALDDPTMHAINDLASSKNTGTQNTYKELIKLLDYCVRATRIRPKCTAPAI